VSCSLSNLSPKLMRIRRALRITFASKKYTQRIHNVQTFSKKKSSWLTRRGRLYDEFSALNIHNDYWSLEAHIYITVMHHHCKHIFYHIIIIIIVHSQWCSICMYTVVLIHSWSLTLDTTVVCHHYHHCACACSLPCLQHKGCIMHRTGIITAGKHANGIHYNGTK